MKLNHDIYIYTKHKQAIQFYLNNQEQNFENT